MMHSVSRLSLCTQTQQLGTKHLICQHCQEHLHNLWPCPQPFPAQLCVLEAQEISDFKDLLGASLEAKHSMMWHRATTGC